MTTATDERFPVPEPALDRRLEVCERAQLAEATIALSLRDPAGRTLPGWEPGAHVDLVLGEGPDGEPLIRQYSLCGDPADPHRWRIAVLREDPGRGGSRLIHDSLRESSIVRVRGPRNAFRLGPAGRYVFIAGGIGVTPILPMVRAVARSGAPWRAIYAVRSHERVCFAEELFAHREVSLHVDSDAGVLDVRRALADCDADTAVYACGPAAMLDAIEAVHAGCAWSLHTERFAPPARAQAPSSAFEVEVASTGQVFTVDAHETILEVLRREGLPVDWSCREGICGTCETAILRGTPDHRDSVLSDEERASGESMMICCSRALSERLVLDI